MMMDHTTEFPNWKEIMCIATCPQPENKGMEENKNYYLNRFSSSFSPPSFLGRFNFNIRKLISTIYLHQKNKP